MKKRKWSSDDPDHDVEETNLLFILPAFVNALGFSCAREWTETKVGYECGCPRCLAKIGLTLIFHKDDWNEARDMESHWRKRIVSVKTASYASHLICPGYELSGGW